GPQTYGLVKAGPNLYRVNKGNYMGQNFGVITGIDEAQISLKELIQEGSGEWIERSSSLQLQEVKK
ncbi:MAG TPA: pilus assembly protein PilP, partial [Burkholderiales bacterium]|nr:pilus assembly protein PilP [Burkholderiales bacterium]